MRAKVLLAVTALGLLPFAVAPSRAEASKLGVAVTFADATALEKFTAYREFLALAPEQYEAELATLSRLERSDIQYVIRIGGDTEAGVEGRLSTDGARVFVTVSNEGGPGEAASLNSRLAHELEHARQFDAGELAFTRNERTGKWEPVYSSYDIGDEVKAWEAQMHVAVPKDYWLVTYRKRKPTLLQLFATAASNDDRVAVLREHGYADRYPVPDADVVFPRAAGFAAGEVIRPSGMRQFFGRVRRIAAAA